MLEKSSRKFHLAYNNNHPARLDPAPVPLQKSYRFCYFRVIQSEPIASNHARGGARIGPSKGLIHTSSEIKTDLSTRGSGRKPNTMPDRILVVDHERVRAEYICLILLDSGYDATFECTSQGGIRKAEEFSPKLLIVDPVMPLERGGDEPVKRIFTETKCKVLLISCGADQEGILEFLDELRSQGCDADSFLTPFEQPHFLLHVRNQISRGKIAK